MTETPRAAPDVVTGSIRLLAEQGWDATTVDRLALAAGRPVIVCAEAGSEWARSIEHESYGVCITPGEPQEMADAIIRLHASTVPLSELGARARNYVCEHASREQATRAYFDWIK